MKRLAEFVAAVLGSALIADNGAWGELRMDFSDARRAGWAAEPMRSCRALSRSGSSASRAPREEQHGYSRFSRP
jgi:hypothetical protein